MPDSVSLRRVRREVRKLDPKLDRADDAYRAAVVMLFAFANGEHRLRKLADATAMPYRDVATWFTRLRANRVLRRDGRWAIEWFDEDTGGIAFWLDVNIALGLMQRVRS